MSASEYHVMVDLETLGTSHDAVILSIGACKFTLDGREPFDKFHVAIDPGDAQRCGLSIDAGTVSWWLSPDRAAAREALLSHERVDLRSALWGFSEWFGESKPIWGNGAAFDNVILRGAYETVGLEPPWQFWHDRCYRTLKALAPHITAERQGTHHDALDDAVTQAKHLQRIVKTTLVLPEGA